VNNEPEMSDCDVWLAFATWELDASWGLSQKIFVGYHSVRAAKGYCGGRRRLIDTGANDQRPQWSARRYV